MNQRLTSRMDELGVRTGVDFSRMFAQAAERTAADTQSAAVSETAAADAAPEETAALPSAAAGVSADIDALVRSAAAEYGVNPALISAVIQAESGFDPTLVSPSGAMGLMQLMPATAKGLGVTDAFDPEQNIDGGVRFLLSQITRFDGDVQKALAAYNCGPGGVTSRGIEDLNDPAQRALLPLETQQYLKNLESILTAAGQEDLLTANFADAWEAAG